MTAASATATRRVGAWALLWTAVALLEAGVAAYTMARLVLGPVSLSPRPPLWLAWLAVALLAYFAATILVARAPTRAGRWQGVALWALTLPFLAAFSLQLAALQSTPQGGAWAWNILSTIEPFPTLAAAVALLVVFLVKLLIAAVLLPGQHVSRAPVCDLAARVAIPAAFVLMGVLQTSVYVVPLGNLFYRSWAVADALTLRVAYPVTATEPQSLLAGSPPYIYDLPLFPVMLSVAFTLLGHNSVAAHLPAALASALFPLSLYLLLRQATDSRVTALLFGTLASLFPFLRFWVLNLPDPDPLLLTCLCLAGYFYLRAVAAPERRLPWFVAGIAAGVLSLARPEGLIYAGFLTLGALASRPGLRRFLLFLLSLGLFLVPTAILWMTNFGFLWPQNYNRTLRPEHLMSNYGILKGVDALGFYQRALGLEGVWIALLLALILGAVAAGFVAMFSRNRPLMAIAVPGIGNFVAVFFTSPGVTNPSHFADFFRHASFGIPFLVVTAAYGLLTIYQSLATSRSGRLVAYVGMLLMVAAVIREGDILANPTATHRPGAQQVLTTGTYLSMQSIVEHPMPLPPMDYHQEGDLNVAYPTSVAWPDASHRYFEPLDMSFDSRGRPFEYGSVVVSLLALCFALLAEATSRRAQTEAWIRRMEGPQGL